MVILNETLKRRGEAEQEHAGWEPEMGLQFLKDDVGGDFEY